MRLPCLALLLLASCGATTYNLPAYDLSVDDTTGRVAPCEVGEAIDAYAMALTSTERAAFFNRLHGYRLQLRPANWRRVNAEGKRVLTRGLHRGRTRELFVAMNGQRLCNTALAHELTHVLEHALTGSSGHERREYWGPDGYHQQGWRMMRGLACGQYAVAGRSWHRGVRW